MENTIDLSLNDYLDQKESEIKNSLIATVYNVGKILKNVKTRLEGTDINFIEWVVKVGISPECARNYVKYYEINEQNCGKLQKLPIQLVIEYGKEDTTPELKEKVLKGEVKTAKALIEVKKENAKLKKELEKITPEVDELQNKYEKEKQEKSIISKRYDQLLEVTAQKDLILAQSNKRFEAEAEALLIDIVSFVNEKIPKIKHFLSKTDKEYQQERVEKFTSEISKTLELLIEV